MKVAELIEILQQLDEEKNIVIDDTAAGFRDITNVEDALGYQYIIRTERPKKGKRR